MLNCKLFWGFPKNAKSPLLEEYAWNIINFVTILYEDYNFAYFIIVMSI